MLSIPVLLPPVVRIEPATFRWLSPLKLREPTPITVTLCVLLDNSEWIFGYYKLNVLTLARITTIMYDFFYLCSYSDFFFLNMNTGKKKIIHNSSNSSQSKYIKFIIPKNSLWIVQQDTWGNGYRRWFPEVLRRQSSAGSILTTGK